MNKKTNGLAFQGFFLVFVYGHSFLRSAWLTAPHRSGQGLCGQLYTATGSERKINLTLTIPRPQSHLHQNVSQGQMLSSLEAAGLVESYLIEILQGLSVKMHEGRPGYILWHGMCAQCFCDDEEENIFPEYRVPCFNFFVCSSIEQKSGEGKNFSHPIVSLIHQT